MLLSGSAPDDCFGAALLGAYECETHGWLELEIARGWDAVVNVGSSEGYYSTGLALRLPGATVYAFEMDDSLRAETIRSSQRNGVDGRVRALGLADPNALATLPLTSALVLCDCEGYERELLDPALIPWLAKSALLVELHEFEAPGVTDVLRARFSVSHEIGIVEQRPRDAATWAARAAISTRDAAMLLEEIRPLNGVALPGRWMLLSPRPVP